MAVVAFDSTFLLVVLHDGVAIPKDPSTRKPWEKGRERVEHLVDVLSEDRSKIVIPTPVLAEVLVRVGPRVINDYLARIRATRHFHIANLDQKAAIELAMLTDAALKSGNKRSGVQAPYQKIKIDRQIFAIARSDGAEILYTADRSLGALASLHGMAVKGFGDLAMPPVADQHDWVGPEAGQTAPAGTKR